VLDSIDTMKQSTGRPRSAIDDRSVAPSKGELMEPSQDDLRFGTVTADIAGAAV
jgi:hypothetical protein